jgi:hypothetical protein
LVWTIRLPATLTAFALLFSMAFAGPAPCRAAQPKPQSSARREASAKNQVRLVAGRRLAQPEAAGQTPEGDVPPPPDQQPVPPPDRPAPLPARPRLQLYQPDCPPLEESPEYIVPLANIKADLRLPEETAVPIDCSAPLFTQLPGETRDAQGRFLWARNEFLFAASDFSHYPLYWDNQPLERYGQSQAPIFEPFFSGAHFFATFAIIPYKIGIDRTCDRIYTLGYYRPGSPTPCLRQTLPWEWDAAAIQALAVVGFVFILP